MQLDGELIAQGRRAYPATTASAFVAQRSNRRFGRNTCAFNSRFRPFALWRVATGTAQRRCRSPFGREHVHAQAISVAISPPAGAPAAGARGQQVPAELVQSGHKSVDDDWDGDGGQDQRAQDRGERREPVAEGEVEDGQGWGKTASQIMAASWCLLGGPSRIAVGVVAGGDACVLAGQWVGCAWLKAWTARRTSSSTSSALIEMAAADPAPATVITWARGSTTFPAAQTPARWCVRRRR